MAYYQNGQYYSIQPQQPQIPYPSRYPRPSPSFDNGDEAVGGAARIADSAYGNPSAAGYGSNPGGGSPGRIDHELFFETSNSLPAHPRSATFAPQVSSHLPQLEARSAPPTQQAYNPQQYAVPTSQYIPQAYGSVNRTGSSASHQPYNPAVYRDGSVQRHSSVISHPYGFSPSAYATPSAYPSPPQQPYIPPAPPHAQQAFAGGPPQSQYSPHLPDQSQQHHYPSVPPSLPPRSSAYTPAASASPPINPYPSDDGRRSSTSQTYQRYPSVSPDPPEQANFPSPSSFPNHDRRHGSASRSDFQSPSPLYASSNPLPSPPAPTPPAHSPQRMHTVSRPLPVPPSESFDEGDYFNEQNGMSTPDLLSAEIMAQDDLYSQVENAVMGVGSARAVQARSSRPEIGQLYNQNDQPTPLFSPPQRRNTQPRNGVETNGHFSSVPPPDAYPPQDEYSDDSDPEAAAGLAAMQLADEQDAAEEARRQSGGSGLYSNFGAQRQTQQQASPDDSNDSDYATMDMDLYGGGYAGHLSYGGDPNTLAAGHRDVNGSRVQSQPVSSTGSMRRSGGSSNADASYEYAMDPIHPFPPFESAARVDTFGTGGLSEPHRHGRRLSYDEGDESALIEGYNIEAQNARAGGEPSDMFYHPGISLHRPLPPPPSDSLDGIPQLMPAGTYQTNWREQQDAPEMHPGWPVAPDAYAQRALSSASALVPRSTSLLSNSSTPHIVQPIRSKTDAEKARLRLQNRSSMYTSTDLSTPPSATAVTLDLPDLPAGRRFNPAKLGAPDFKKCSEPWALSAVVAWLQRVTEGEPYLKRQALVEGLVALFTHKVPTMNTTDAEMLSERVMDEMFEAGAVVKNEEWLYFRPTEITGVIYQLTGAGCYAPTLHNFTVPGRCYAHQCQRTLKKIDLRAQPQRQTEDWATFYKLKKDDVANADKKEIEVQNNLHEIVTTEDGYMDQLRVLLVLYRDALAATKPPVITPKRIMAFLKDVFGKVDAVKKANEDFLLAQLKYRQQEQGPWVKGFSDIFREWIRKAKNAYIEYAAAFPNATFLVRQEMERNIEFQRFLDQARNHKLSNKLGWDTYLKAPITRLQHYGLLLSTVHKNMREDSEEKANLHTAIEEIRIVTLECDARVAEMSRKGELLDLGSKLILRPGMKGVVELNLNHLGRELIFKGDLQRQGTNRFTWLETHALLFDHYLVMAKTVTQRDAAGGLKYERYDVSRLPIPMDLLVLESTNDEPVQKSSMKGIAAVTTVTARAGTPQDPRLARTSSNQTNGPVTLTHTNTASSLNSLHTINSTPSKLVSTTTMLEGSAKDSEKTMYPFRIKHLGKEVYTLFAPSASNRQDWCDKIILAKTKHAAALFAQNAEPFKLRVIADSAFAYETVSGGSKGITIKNTPLDRAVQEVERKFANTGRPVPICRARVNCATAFNMPYPQGMMVAVGTDYGVYVSDMDNPRGWSKTINILRVTQIAVLEEFNLFLVISDKALIAYHLDVVCPADRTAPTSSTDSARKAPQKLSGTRDVGFFATGRMKDRTLVFYKKRESLSSTFKVLEPVFQKATEKKRGMFKGMRGTTEFFREYDEFYIPTECFSINLFQSSLAVATSKGFEVLTLDKKQPWSIPSLKDPSVATIAARLTEPRQQQPLGMFRLSDIEFLLCYEDCAVYVNKHGDINRSVVMNFVGKAERAVLTVASSSSSSSSFPNNPTNSANPSAPSTAAGTTAQPPGRYLILFCGDFVEIREAQNGRLKQIIAGRDVKCLDDGTGRGVAGGTVKMVMQHPELERVQIVVELLLNEGLRE
ncbi:hypothetical protein LTR04_003376 [Oleoguttula sp. CCFEE 6159]|nr:hypothetical protein LTR04_003376 [Oleoguttula sp. CCFEE 6159]